MINLVEHTGNKIIFLADEWDSPIRENPKIQNVYLEFLQSLFKNSGVTARVFAAAYMTGILPIKKDGSQSALSDFNAATMKRLEESDKLFADTIEGNEEAVAAQIEKVHAEETTPINYNREECLRGIIKLAYYTYRDHYIKFEELPAGKGFADVVYLPKHDSGWPALVVELKWDKSAQGAIDQILEKQYPDALQDYGSEIILVGVNYDPKTKKHECKIRRVE